MSETVHVTWFAPDRPVQGQTVYVRPENGWFTPATPPPPAQPAPVTVCQCGEPIEIGQPYDALVRNREHEDENGNYHIASTTAIARWHVACGERIEIRASIRAATEVV